MKSDVSQHQGTTQSDPSSKDAAVSAPSITLPKGGGAIRGIGEKFAANPVTGTGSMSVPIATSPGRSGFGPQLSLAYDSGAGNGPFGFGWSLSIPSITRKTDKGLPQYFDRDESDVFILSGAEDLVPVLNPDGSRFTDTTTASGYTIDRYRPRIEGLFAHIERWTNLADSSDVHWRSISRDNILTLYGKDAGSRIADPAAPQHIFTWLICETRDDKGNAVVYEYAPEDGAGVVLGHAHERNRGDANDPRRTANRYIKRIRYGNRVPLLDNTGRRPRVLEEIQAQLDNAGWMFELVFDYDEGHVFNETTNSDRQTFVEASTAATKPWAFRDDPFSSYRAGFEVRTCRLCQRALMFHHIPDFPTGEQGYDGLVRSTDFTYSYELNPTDARNPIYSFLLSVSQSGYKGQNGGYLKRSLPSVEYEYTQPIVQDIVHYVDAASLENLPIGMDGAAYQWTDLDGEGIAGILSEQAGGWFYKRNISPISARQVEFTPLESVTVKPSLGLAGGQAQFMDLAGDGRPDLVVLDGPTPGLYEHDGDEGWQPFRPFSARLSRDMRDPNLKFVDLNGDGHADVLISEDGAFVWHASLAEQGFGQARRVPQALDEEHGPRLVFADGTQSVYLADCNGDGLTDLMRIRNGAVCYWPNMGYGRFGAKVTMDNAPYFDHPDQFDHKRIRPADIDGSGTIDIIYLHRDGVRLYFNQSGNSWGAPQTLRIFPRVDDLVSIAPIDLRGNGTACLVWSSPLPGDTQQPMRYVDLMGGQKPHLLVKTVNNLGAETVVQYAPSIQFYLQDKRDGKPWITRLPFPVHVVEQVETNDRISGNRFVTRYAYHHGYFDGEEREFRGFGMVEQHDTEEFAALTADGTLSEATNLDAASHVPPVFTKTWFHTGVYLERNRISTQLAKEYYGAPAFDDPDYENKLELFIEAELLPDTVLPAGLSLAEEREACRALKGSMLRQEVYALDGTDKTAIPYTIAEQNFTIVPLQPQRQNRHAVFFTHAREAISHHYERNPADPRISHALTLEVDPYGNVLKSLAIGYGRRQSPLPERRDRDKQTTTLITYTDNRFTIDDLSQPPDDYRTPLPAETRTYELTGFKPEHNAARFSFDEWTRSGFALLTSVVEIPYEQTADNISQQKRLIEHVRTRYRKNDLTALLPFGVVESLALPGESYKLAFTPGLLEVYAAKIAVADLQPILRAEGNYVDLDGNGHWWIPAGRVFFSPVPPDPQHVEPAAVEAAQELIEARAHFFLPRRYRDPFFNNTVVDYTYDLLATTTRDPLDNTVHREIDYRLLQPWRMTDPNGNRSAAAFDALGMVVATAIMGKNGEGDQLEGFDTDLTQAELDAFFAAPRPPDSALLGKATTRILYDVDRWQRAGQPVYGAILARETHVADLPANTQSNIQVSFGYSDGFGREIQKKIQAEPGPLVEGGPLVSPRWVGSGWTIFNNKGKPVRQYEPFFSPTHDFQFANQVGVSPILFYDPVGRVVATLHPNQTYEKVVFDPWLQTSYDVNDTVAANGAETGDPRTDADIQGYVAAYFKTQPPTWQTWYQQRIGGVLGGQEQRAAFSAAAHANTPTTAHFDTLGRPFLTLAHNGFESDGTPIQFPTRVELDIEGNQRSVTDALGRMVMRYDYNMLGSQTHSASMEAGERWILNDIAGKPLYCWDSRDHRLHTVYDVLRRPTEAYLQEGSAPELLVGITLYGEGRPNPEANNLRGKPYQAFDGAGVITTGDYDFKGNLLSSSRQLAVDYKNILNWSATVGLEAEIFTAGTSFDALNRPVTLTMPDNSVIRPVFNEANLLNAVDANLRGEELNGQQVWTPFVTNIDYSAKGQRERIEYDNGATTRYGYDDKTFRLIQLMTTRRAGGNGLASSLLVNPATVQDLRYTYDPAGNITEIADAAIAEVIYDNQSVRAVSQFTYDAIYRLIAATGREHIGQNAFDFNPPDGNRRDYPFVGLQANPNDPKAVRNYAENYEYDVVGNFEKLIHQAANGNWMRAYRYAEPSLIEPRKKNNRLSSTTIGSINPVTERHTYDAHGSMTSIKAMQLAWDYQDQLQSADLGGGGTAYYVYDAAGQRVRKVWEKAPGLSEERIYLGGFEVYRKRNGNGSVTLQRETLHLMDGSRSRVGMVETRTQGDDGSPAQLIRYQLGNHLGSASLELSEAGDVISYEEYYPYGSTSYQAVDKSIKAAAKRYRYTGKERDEETGLCYHGARYYAPWLGRWASCDPLMHQRSHVSPYAGMGNSPALFMDQNGKQETTGAVLQELRMLGPEGYREAHREQIAAGTAVGELLKYGLSQPPVAGTLQIIGGGFEISGGGALLAAPEPTMVTKGAGVVLVAHGTDTLSTGIVTLTSGEIQQTYAAQVGERAALAREFSPETAKWIGVGVDVGVPLGAGALVATSETLRNVTILGDDFSEAAATAIQQGAAEGVQEMTPRFFPADDPLVTELALKIEARYPGHVQGVTRDIYDDAGRLITDFDIELRNAVIQVNSGHGKGLTTQLQTVEGLTSKVVIGYGPNLRGSVVRGVASQGILITRDESLLIDVVAP